jgi:ADP-ribose pyrophosphatase YjhB (NUDIX family)
MMDSTPYDEMALDAEEQDMLWSSKGMAVLGLIEHDGQVLLAATHMPGTGIWWQLPGGVAVFGETLPQSLRRQLLEDAGLDVTVEDLLYVMEIESHMIFTFKARLNTSVTLSEATVDCCFVSRDQLRSFPRLWGREPLLAWLEKRGQGKRYYSLTQQPMHQ